MKSLEYQLNEPGDIPNVPFNRYQRKMKTIAYLLTALIVILIIFFVISVVYLSHLKNDNDLLVKEKNKIKDENIELKNQNLVLSKLAKNAGFNFELFGEKLTNLTYGKNNITIENSFKEGGANDNGKLRKINDGKDYEVNGRNKYDLYIPYSAIKKSKEYNKILLFLHGGAWIEGNKESFDIFCRTYASMGYITATIGYTLLNEVYKDYNIYRIIDEITAAIQSIKEKLIEEGFDGKKLELAIGGGSAGGHLALLYAYAYSKNSPIPIQFVINLCGPIGLEEEYFLKLVDYDDTLENIDYNSVQEAINENKTMINEDEISLLINLINLFLGRAKDEDMNELFDNETKTIKKESPKYKELYDLVQYSFPIIFIDENTLPTLCVYGGRDNIVGISAYANLQKKFNDNGNYNISLVYSRYAPHNPISFDTENGIEAAREMNYQILNFSDLYFTKDQN